MHPLVTIYSQTGNVLFPVWEHDIPKLGIIRHPIDNGYEAIIR